MTSLPRVRPAYTADERTQLLGWLDMQRAVIPWKCEGLSEEAAHRPVLPASPLMTMAGVVAHLRWVEQLWFEVVLLDRPASGPGFDDGPRDAEMKVDGVPIAEIVADYERQCAVSNEIAAGLSLEDVARGRRHPGVRPSLRWTVFHMIEETARHAGHLDAIRELLDGERGYY